ncbi:MAG: ABC transporter ATP-binding protein [Chloroflexi bacterium]|nr:MAG: ABC transporter ATP-binding protein [Chloroflexota bacterium]
MTKPAVKFENVSKRYRLGIGHSSLRDLVTRPFRKSNEADEYKRTLWALRNVSFEVERGSALGLIGPNGSGKTTSLKILSRITQPTSGKVEINGRISALIELGAGFHPDLTGRENVYLNATILGMTRKEIEKRFDEIVAFSGLERFIDTPVKRYSSGMYVRLGFSVAAHVEPDVLLVDEVLAVGDAQFRQKCARRIEELQKLGTTIVFVAHNLYLVKSVCDKAVFLLNGEVQYSGDVDDAIKAYEDYIYEQQAKGAKVTHHRLSGASNEIAITNVEVRHLGGAVASEEFLHSDPVEIRVHYRAQKPIRDPKVVLRIRRADGTTAAMIRTADYGIQLDDLEGEGDIAVLVDPLQLASGAFMVNASLFGPIDGVPLAWADSRWFRVVGISPGHEELSGVFVPRVARAYVEPQRPFSLMNGNETTILEEQSSKS